MQGSLLRANLAAELAARSALLAGLSWRVGSGNRISMKELKLPSMDPSSVQGGAEPQRIWPECLRAWK